VIGKPPVLEKVAVAAWLPEALTPAAPTCESWLAQVPGNSGRLAVAENGAPAPADADSGWLAVVVESGAQPGVISGAQEAK
jgi:hypothetical protein